MKGSTITEPPENPETDRGIGRAGDSSPLKYVNSIISETEVVHKSFRTPGGVTRIRGGERVAVDQTVVTAVTDRRILFTTPVENNSGAVSLEYDEIASISVVDDTLAVRTIEGMGIEWSLPESKTADSALGRHLSWVGDVRSRLRSCQNDIELAAGEIRTLADDLSWEEAKATYREAREQLDELLNDIFCTEPISLSTLAPEVTDIERTLERAHTRLFIERAQSQLELGRQLVENGDYEQGRKVLKQAQDDHARARRQRDAVERGDAFQFGTQRTLREDIESLGWKIETVAAEPIRQAHEAKIKAETADSPSEELTHWEQAFRRYGHVLTLEWGSEKRNFAGDPETVREESQQAARNLVTLHSARADEYWNEGVDRQASGESKQALRCCLEAQEHLERAHELATEFQPDGVSAIAARLETMADEVMRMRHGKATEQDTDAPQAESPEESDSAETAKAESSAEPTDPPAADETESETPAIASSERQLPSASELAEMDTHHEITLDSEDLQVSSTDRDADTPESQDSSPGAKPTGKKQKPENVSGEQTHH